MSKGVELSKKYETYEGDEFKGLDFYRKRARLEYPGEESCEEIALEAWHTDIRKAVAALVIPRWKEESREEKEWKGEKVSNVGIPGKPTKILVMESNWYTVESVQEPIPGQFLIRATKRGKL